MRHLNIIDGDSMYSALTERQPHSAQHIGTHVPYLSAVGKLLPKQ